LAAEKSFIADTVAAMRARFARPADAARRGPVPLAGFLEEFNLLHVALPELTRASIAEYLRGQGIAFELPEPDGQPPQWLAGFLMTAGADGYVFVGDMEPKAQNDGNEPKLHSTPLGRKRFTAAHELGHFLLHRERMGAWIADTAETVVETDGDDDLREMERQANYFAAALLMPEELCRARGDDFRNRYQTCPRTPLAYFLASELLVSPEAMRNRLRELQVGDE
jgi:hypothetical protein